MTLDKDQIDEAERVVRDAGRASISLVQRRMRIGFMRADKLIRALVKRGVVSEPDERGLRMVLTTEAGE